MATQKEGNHLSQPGKMEGSSGICQMSLGWGLAHFTGLHHLLVPGQCRTGWDAGFTLKYWWVNEWIPGKAQRTKEHCYS